MKKIKIIELFAGVGGFRKGFLSDSNKDHFEIVWFNQWEPGSKNQHAFKIYQKKFKDTFNLNSNKDITLVPTSDIPDHDLLVGGFPCQDYSVARSLVGEKGIEGKKGVLFWEILRILKDKKTKFFLLENVDRLIKSPSFQKGRDFLVMLKALSDIGYSVEWRIIKSSDYGDVQNRRRVYLFGFLNSTDYYKTVISKTNILPSFFLKSFKANFLEKSEFDFSKLDLIDISDKGVFDFFNSGISIQNKIYNFNVQPITKKSKSLESILDTDVSDEYYLNEEDINKVKYLKDKKKILRNSNGFKYYFSEGKIPFPDDTSKPARTILTSEGQLNRSSHFIMDKKGIRFLTPTEVERINGFPKNWTNVKGISQRKRYFLMGNALSIKIIHIIAKDISIYIK